MKFDAFSSGQISSKLWLCESLEIALQQLALRDVVIWILGGWYGLTGFLLLSRDRCSVRYVRSFDIDPSCQPTADLLNENWLWQDWRFKAFTVDCCKLDYQAYGALPDVIINTSIEHMPDTSWWNLIPPGTLLALQSCDMPHKDHCMTFQNADQFANRFVFTKTIYQGERLFKYPTWEFTRFMRIGIK